MAEKVKKEKKDKKVVNPTEGQTSVQESAEEVAPVGKKTKKAAEPKDSGKAAATTKAAKANPALKNEAPPEAPGPKRVPGNSKSPEEVKPETKQAPAPSNEEIAQLAHHYWKERGGHHGSHEQDWFRAEQELRGKAS